MSCRALGVSQSWFYKWRNGELPPRAARRERLKAEIARCFGGRQGRDGSPRIIAVLRDAGWRVGENMVVGLMAELGLAARQKKKRRATTRPGKGRWRAPDRVKRSFAVGGINRRWYGDGTEIATGEGKLYLDSVLDMGSRRILGHALGEHHDAELACGALAMAAAIRGMKARGVIFHSDQAARANSTGRRVHLGTVLAGLRPARHPPVHGPAGLGAGRCRHRVVALDAGVRAQVPAQVRDQSPGAGSGRARIEDYNHVRRHSALGMVSPVDYERALAGKDAG